MADGLLGRKLLAVSILLIL